MIRIRTRSAITDIQLLQHSKRHESQAKRPWWTVLALLIFALPAFAQGPAYPYSVSLPFIASIGTVTGYNMYRGTYGGTSCAQSTYAKLNATPFTTTTYTDANPPQGAYCYAATALDNSEESGFSNFVGPVYIPPPPPTNLGFSLSSTSAGNEVQFAWTQSSGTGIKTDSLYCSVNTKAPMGRRWSGLATSHNLTLEAGTHYCAVTATAAGNESAFSNIVTVAIP